MANSYLQDPIAVVGMACRLPGHSNSPHALWKLLEAGKCADIEPPSSRFAFKTHYDGSQKPKTMRSPGGMFMEDIDPKDFDAAFFSVSAADAIAMDPQQRQLLEVVYECLENAGIPLHSMDGAAVGCFVGSYAGDYADMQSRDPEDRVPGVTVGVGRALLSNRLSHFLNIKGPSMTIDTACSGSLVSLDVACRYLQSREISGAIVAGANLYLNPEHVMDTGAMKGACSLSGKCHTWDAKADGYIKAEGVNAVMIKRLDDAIKDGDPIRAIIRGTATNSDGWTPGIASPSSDAQAAAIKAAYRHAGITNLEDTTYLECHGTGTQAGDPIELAGAASVFGAVARKTPLLIGSIKSNIGHSEPAAGISGLLKAILTLEHNSIPGNPTFVTPNPKIDFEALQLKANRYSTPWPTVSIKRASVNSFGYGGSNVHCVVDACDQSPHKSSFRDNEDFEDFFGDTTPNEAERPYLLVLSANDETSLRGWASRLSGHLMSPEVSISLPDLAYTLSERRSRFFHRGFLLAKSINEGLDTGDLIIGKPGTEPPRIGFVFTGQGAQWSQMGKQLLQTFPGAREVIQRLDKVLQSTPNPPSWSLLRELTEPRSPQVLRKPEFSQPLVTALQLAMVHVLRDCWGIAPQAVVGHSSGEIAAAYTAGYLREADAIKAAFYRGQAALDSNAEDVGMLAAGVGPEAVSSYLLPFQDDVQVACYNSPDSITISGKVSALEEVKHALVEDGHFARMLQVNLAYHSKFMNEIGGTYETMLYQVLEAAPIQPDNNITWHSSVSGKEFPRDAEADAPYWKSNMVSPVRFDSALREMISGKTGCNFLIEIGPSGALSGPITQIRNSIAERGAKVEYCSALTRGQDAVNAMFEAAGRLFVAGAAVDLASVNRSATDSLPPATIVDLPNYSWNHSTKYWYENDASRDWRYRMFPHHDLLGGKVLGASYHSPVWRKTLAVEDLPWLRDHKMGPDIVFPAAGFIAMAVEGMRQISEAEAAELEVPKPQSPRYRVRDSTFPRALVLEEGKASNIMTTMAKVPGTKNPWFEFKILSKAADIWSEHCRGLIRIEQLPNSTATSDELAPLRHTSRGDVWYKALNEVGYGFGQAFQKHLQIECTSGKRSSRSIVDLSEPESAYSQSAYPMHPAAIDGCLQTCAPALWNGNRSSVNAVLIPATIDDLLVCSPPADSTIGEAVSVASAQYVGVGRTDQTKNYMGNATIYDPESGAMLFRVRGLRFHQLDMDQNDHFSQQFTRLHWAPDVDFLSQSGMTTWLDSNSAGDVDQVLDLLAHKNPSLKIAEITLVSNGSNSIWLDGSSGIRQCCRNFSFLSSDAKALVSAQELYASRPGVTFEFFDPSQFATDDKAFSLVILRVDAAEELPREILTKIHTALGGMGRLLLIKESSDDSDTIHTEDTTSVTGVLNEVGFAADQILSIEHGASMGKAYLVGGASKDVGDTRSRRIELVYFHQPCPVTRIVKYHLETLGWSVTERSLLDGISDSSDPLLILDELVKPVLSAVSSDQWEALQTLLASDRPMLWVTKGSQMQVTNPENAMIHGLCRTVRAEDPSVAITTLDVESNNGEHTVSIISTVLDHIMRRGRKTEHEFVERQGIVYVSRVLPNDAVNQMSHERTHGTEFEDVKLHDHSSTVRLIAERLGTLDALQYNEIGELPLGPNRVEVELEAASLNFKDLAITMGIVPENEQLLGLEGAGIVRRAGSTDYNVGDRVLVFEKGTFANRIIATTERIYRIPEWMSFEDAATVAGVYLVSLYSLYDLANVQPGQRVLIHSATGGLGIACIKICQYIGAEIFATAGSEVKRKFLKDEFNIPETNIFNSRTTEFAEQLMETTNREGVDCIINSLTGELLDESWRCIRPGGTMVELGKKDMLDRNFLSMETFGRNVSYRCVDMAHKQITDELIARLFKQLMPLVEQKILTPINPIKTFAWDEIPEAFRYMRGSNHIGKIVISKQTQGDVAVKVRPIARELRLNPDVSYLIVGGLKGLCGSLAIQLARRGAKHIVAMARSGYADDVSQSAIMSVESEGAEIQLLVGDVSCLEDVQRVFSTSNRPIAGIIQGAMVLRDKIFTSMTIDDFRLGVTPKVTGTWNLHNVAIEQGLDLDFFTMLSSISGVVGQKGQAQYAAANVFLDAFAAYRRQVLGLRANSVDLGAVEDVGYVSRNTELLQIFDPTTWTPINEPRLLEIVEQSILQQFDKSCPVGADEAQLITGIAVPLGADSPLLANDARFAGLFFGNQSDDLIAGDGVDKELSTLLLLARSPPTDATNNQVLDLCVEVVNRQFQKILRLPEPMEPAKQLNSYGLDSLAAVELRNWIRKDLSADLTTLDVTNATSLIGLCEKIVAKIQIVQ